MAPLEHQDHESCASIMDMIELATIKSAQFGSEFAGRNWMYEKEDDAKVAAICKDTVSKLREAYRELSVAEEIVEKRASSVKPEKKSLVMRMLSVK